VNVATISVCKFKIPCIDPLGGQYIFPLCWGQCGFYVNYALQLV